jgi:hypothetical protein
MVRFFVVTTAFFTIKAYLRRDFHPSVPLTTSTIDIQTDYPLATAKILRVSMLYGLSNSFYERAIDTHRRHARRWNHGFQVLREDLASGFWNKPTYLLYSVTQELIKPGNDRAEWLMWVATLLWWNSIEVCRTLADECCALCRWVDADSIIINPAIPPELFLPPSNLPHINFVGTRDHNGLNSGIFYLRVCSWSVSFLVETLALSHAEIDLGRSADQEAMARVLEKEHGGPKGQGYRDGVAFVPRKWINAYEWIHAFEGSRGDMLVHFPGLEEARWEHMSKWLKTVETTPEEWELPLKDTIYRNVTDQFWQNYNSALDSGAGSETLQMLERQFDR